MILIVVCLMVAFGAIDLVIKMHDYEIKKRRTEAQIQKLEKIRKESEERLKTKAKE